MTSYDFSAPGHSITLSKNLTLYADDYTDLRKAGTLMGTNTWDNWYLIPASRPSIASPSISTKYIEIPGRSGAIDFSEYICGRVIYGNRSGSWEFYVDNDHEDWETIRMKIINHIHGRKLYASLEDDPRFFWEGRFSMDEWKSEATNSKVTINYSLAPYKIAVKDVQADADVIWNTFNFERDADWRALIDDLLNGVAVTNSTVTKTVPQSEYFMAVSARCESGDTVTIEFDGRRLVLNDNNRSGVLYSDDLSGGVLTISGTGTVTFGFRERSL